MNRPEWTASSWRSFPIAQAPDYPDAAATRVVEERIKSYPALVFDRETDLLKSKLAAVARGEVFLLQGGDCAESFSDFKPQTICDNFRLFLQMAMVLTFGAKRPVLKVGRVAGQFGKPRSSPNESRENVHLSSYRGDIMNGIDFTPEARRHNPERMERAYFQSAATLNTLRSFAKGGLADLHKVHTWNLEFVSRNQVDPRYEAIVSKLNDTLAFMRATGLSAQISPLETTDFFTSHEALLLNYEEALVRRSDDNGADYAGSAHLLWIGERTRTLDGAHVEFARGIANPLGIKCGPETKVDELLHIIDRLNPENEPGRITLIPRLGAGRVAQVLPKLIRRIKGEGRTVVWCCDPMHGNTVATKDGIKTRSFADIVSETQSFFAIHQAEGTVAGGVHVEITGKNVTECTGGGQQITGEQLQSSSYETLCDPRLNASQALELAFELSASLKLS